MTLRKILAPLDFAEPDKINKGFLYPNIDAEDMESFLDMATGKQWELGMVVFVGRNLSKNDVFAKIVGSGKKIKSVEVLLNCIEDYLRQVDAFRIGDVIGIRPSANGFELIKLAKPKRTRSKLPK